MRTLYRDGRIHSLDAPDGSAVMIEDGVVAWVGDEDGAQSLADGAGAVDEAINLHGALVTPGFVDARVNLTETGLRLTSVDLSGAKSLKEALERIDSAARAGRGRPILGGGWDERGWPEARPPTARELDRAGYGGTTFMLSADGRRAVASTPVLRALPRSPDGAERGGSGESGAAGESTASGGAAGSALRGEAMAAARAVARSALLPTQHRAAQRRALEAAAAAGICAVHGFSEAADAAAEGTGGIEAGPEVADYIVDSLSDALTPSARGSQLDASQLDASSLGALIQESVSTGTQFAFDVSELSDIEPFLALLEAQAVVHGIGLRGARHRIERAMAIDDPARMAALGLVAILQPHAALNLGAVAAAGVLLAFGSDAPFVPGGASLPADVERPFDPWAAIRAATLGAGASGPTRLSARAAFTAHTRAGWRAARRDEVGAGTLRVGAPAHLAIWAAGSLTHGAIDDRLSRWSTDQLAGLPGLPDLAEPLPRCLRTVVAGRTAFDSGELS
jgi:predicted amidohydrolase YtcJ